MGSTNLMFPLRVLKLAGENVRKRTRKSSYLENTDKFATLLLGGPLGVEPVYRNALVTDLTVIDFEYERLVDKKASPSRLERTTWRLQEAVDPSSALHVLLRLQSRLDEKSCSFRDVACIILATITILGHGELLQRTAAASADRWLALWQNYVWEQDSQQERHSDRCLRAQGPGPDRARVKEALGITPEALRPSSTTFADGVREYLEMFSETAACNVALIGAIPFAKMLSNGEELSGTDVSELIEFFSTNTEFLQRISWYLRLAQDVYLDPKEALSTGVFALAAEAGVDILSIDPRQPHDPDINRRLRAAWRDYDTEFNGQMHSLLNDMRSGEKLRRALTDVVGAVVKLAEKVREGKYKGLEAEPA